MNVPALLRPRVEAFPRPHLSVVPSVKVRRGDKLLLLGTYVLAATYHWLNSRGHVTPVVFGDELFYSKLAQSVAAGDGFTVDGQLVLFPSVLPVVSQVPAWFLESTSESFAALKAMNAFVMSVALFPLYALARRVARPSFAVVVAVAAVAGPPMLYHAYLMSEALAYPIFFLACATIVRAIAQPSRGMEMAVVAVCAAACLTRLQFIVLPLAYLAAAPLAARLAGESLRTGVRRHRLSLAALALLVALPLLTGGLLLGTYMGAALLDYAPVDVLSWSAFTAVLLAFAAGWLVVPGALCGLATMLLRPRSRAEAAVGILLALLITGMLLEVGLIAAGEAHRAMERYAIYLVPFAFLGFFAYVERGAPHRRVYAALALVLGGSAWLVAFPVRAGTLFTFDTPTYSVYAQLATWWGHPNAATVFAAVPLLGGCALAALHLRRQRVPLAIGVSALTLVLLSSIPAYAGDRAVTKGMLELRAGSPPDWLDRSAFGRADFLQLPGGSGHYGWLLETWNRDFGRAAQLGLRTYDGFATTTAKVDPRGRLLIDGRPPKAGVLVVNNVGTQLALEGIVVARPLPGLVAVRHPAAPRVRLLAVGLMHDGWAEATVRVRAWPRRAGNGAYRVRLQLPRRFGPRRVVLSVTGSPKHVVTMGPGTTKTLEIRASGRPLPSLRIDTDQATHLGAGTVDGRLVGIRILSLSYRLR